MKKQLVVLCAVLLLAFAANAREAGSAAVFDNSIKSYFQSREGDPILALSHLKKAQDIAHELNEQSKIGLVLFHKGYVYRRLGMYDLALTNYLSALSIAEKIGDAYLNGWVLLDIANLYRDQKNNDKAALDYYAKAEKVFSSSNDLVGVVVCNYCKGELYQNNKAYEQAIPYFEKAQSISLQINDSKQQAIALAYLGETYALKKELLAAERIFSELTDLCVRTNNKDGMARAYKGLGLMALGQGTLEVGLEYYHKALNCYHQINDKLNIAAVLDKIGDAYAASGNINEAIKFSEMALSVADSNEIVFQQQVFLKKLTGYYNVVGSTAKVLETQRKYILLQDQERSKNALVIQREYELELLRKDKVAQEELIHKQNILIVAAVAVVVVFLVLFVLIVLKNRRLKESYQHLFASGIELKKNKEELLEIKIQTKYVGSTLRDEKQEALLQDFNRLMNEQKVYLQSDLSLDTLAKQMNSNRTYLSQVLNDHFNNSFSNLINEYRVREAQNMLLDPANKVFTIEAIAVRVGFNSKSTFNHVFKKTTGLTPSLFIEMKEQEIQSAD